MTDIPDIRPPANAEWRETTLKEVAEIIMGQSPPGSTYNEHGDGLPFFQGAKDFNYRHPSQRVFCSSPTRIAEIGDILFSVRAPIGRVNVADRKCATGRGLAIIRPHASIADARYIEFYLRHMENSWGGIEGGGTVFGTATKRDVENLAVDLPPLADQRRISAALGALDDKIALNARMNETLDETASALFQAWFVDFVPVRAKISGAWRRGESRPGLPAALYDLFPDALEDSALGEIPAGWEVGEVSDFFDLNMGQSPPGDTYNENGDGMPFFQGKADFDFRYPNNRQYCVAPKRVAKADDTLVSVRAPVGTINMAWERCCIGRGLAALRHKSGSASFTYYALKAMQGEIEQYEDNGTVFGSIGKRQFAALPTLEPPGAAIAAFGEYAAAWDSRIRINTSESRALAAMRDTLLPKLLSGEMSV